MNDETDITYFHPIQIFKKANELYLQGNIAEAIVAYQAYNKLNTNFYCAWHNLGEALVKQGRLDEAVSAYRRAIELNPNSAWSYHNLGELLLKQGDINEAVSLYQQASQIKTDVPEFLSSLADSLVLQGQAHKAGKIYIDLAEIFFKKQKNQYATIFYIKALDFIDLKQAFISKIYWWNNRLIYKKNQQNQDKSQIVKIILYSLNNKLEKHKNYHHLYDVLKGDILTAKNEFEQAIPCYQNAAHKILINRGHRSASNPASQSLSNGKPDFLIIGQAKCGTTSLFAYLTRHPNIIPSAIKEIDFWNLSEKEQEQRSMEWYLAHFPCTAAAPNLLTGEANPANFSYNRNPQKIKAVFPRIKLIVIFRNPIARSISHVNHWVRVGWESRSLEQALSTELEMLGTIEDISQVDADYYKTQHHYLLTSLYIYPLKKWMASFDRSQFLIVKSENMFANPAKTMEEVFTFLGLADRSQDRYSIVNSGNYDRNAQISQELHDRLENFFAPHNRKLEEYLGRSFDW